MNGAPDDSPFFALLTKLEISQGGILTQGICKGHGLNTLFLLKKGRIFRSGPAGGQGS